jgi:DNA-directed RNA polymerase subunit RPC12/RpoP
MVENVAYIHFQCRTCLKRYKAHPRKAGQRVRCPACRSRVTIPGDTVAGNRLPLHKLFLQKLARML